MYCWISVASPFQSWSCCRVLTFLQLSICLLFSCIDDLGCFSVSVYYLSDGLCPYGFRLCHKFGTNYFNNGVSEHILFHWRTEVSFKPISPAMASLGVYFPTPRLNQVKTCDIDHVSHINNSWSSVKESAKITISSAYKIIQFFSFSTLTLKN